MNLRSQLARLQQQTGNTPSTTAPSNPAPSAEPTESLGGGRSLREQLAGLSLARRQLARQSRPDDAALARWLGGRCLAPGLIIIERCLPFGSPHGRSRLEGNAAAALGPFGHDLAAGGTVVFLDSETTGLSGGVGTLVFLLGVAALTPRGLHVRQYLLTRFQGEPALLWEASDLLRHAGTFVTYNGKAFDHPLLASRYRLAQLEDPLSALVHVDLLLATRRAFAGRWPDCRLQTVEAKLLGFLRTDDLPSAWVPQVWFDWMRQGITERLPRLLRHNHWDLISLVALAPALQRCYRDPVANGANVSIARHHFVDESQTYCYLRAHQAHLDRNGLLELGRLARRRGHWSLAVAIWQRLAAEGNSKAIEQLAKYYEHVDRNIALALRFTQELIALDPGKTRHRQREQRLLAKPATHHAEAKLRAANAASNAVLENNQASSAIRL